MELEQYRSKQLQRIIKESSARMAKMEEEQNTQNKNNVSARNRLDSGCVGKRGRGEVCVCERERENTCVLPSTVLTTFLLSLSVSPSHLPSSYRKMSSQD